MNSNFISKQFLARCYWNVRSKISTQPECINSNFYLPAYNISRSERMFAQKIRYYSSVYQTNHLDNMIIKRQHHCIYKGIQHSTIKYIHVTKPVAFETNQNKVNQDLSDILKELYKENNNSESSKENKATGLVSTKFNVYKDEDSPVIYDIDEERALNETRKREQVTSQDKTYRYKGINLNHGINGVFDTEELVELLKLENCIDICVIDIPSYINYHVPQIVIATCKSKRTLHIVGTYVRKVYKIKRSNTDKPRKNEQVPKVHGLKEKSGWLTMDMGNIGLHLFTQDMREKYNLESLWGIGPEFELTDDEKYNDLAFLEDMIPKSSDIIADIEPLEYNDVNFSKINHR